MPRRNCPGGSSERRRQKTRARLAADHTAAQHRRAASARDTAQAKRYASAK